MTKTTRRVVFLCLLVATLAVPAEMVLLQALKGPRDAARAWAGDLSIKDRDAAAGQITQYPVAYRRELLRVFTPERRAEIWKANMAQYVEAHPELHPDALRVLNALMTLATPANLTKGSESARRQVTVLAGELTTLLGRSETEYLLYRLGPKDGTFDSIEPFSHKLASRVRGWAVAVAAEAAKCDCDTSWGCDGFSTYCASNSGCAVDDDWPKCGWFWNSPCDGRCAAGSGPRN
jgi:hypothetical protein